jgi:hypothetical protein
MMIRTKEVIIISSDGSSVSTVIKMRICKVKLYSVPSTVSLTLIAGRPTWALRGKLTSRSDARHKINATGDINAFFGPMGPLFLIVTIELLRLTF